MEEVRSGHGGVIIASAEFYIKGRRTFPAASVSQWPASCGQKTIPGATVEISLFAPKPDASMLGRPIQSGIKAISIALDRKSYSIAGAENWVWTLTPAAVQ